MRKAFIAILLLSWLQAQPIIVKTSPYDFKSTYKKLIHAIKAKKLEIFCVIDHSKNAQKVAQKLPPTKLILFGNPAMGTKLMQNDPRVAIELPLHIAILQHGKTTQIVYKNPKRLKHYAISQNIIEKITNLYKSLVDEATR